MKTEIRTVTDKANPARCWDVFTSRANYNGQTFEATSCDRAHSRDQVLTQLHTARREALQGGDK